MIPGTTPTHTFEIPTEIEKSLIKTVKIVYSQNNKVVFIKETEDCEIEEGKITVRLTQEETLACKFEPFVSIQIRILTHNDDALASNVMVDIVQRSLDDEVIE